MQKFFMKRNNGWPRVKILESGKVIPIPIKGKRVVSRNGIEYLRYERPKDYTKSYYGSLSSDQKSAFFEKAQKRLNDNEHTFMKSRFDRIANQEKHSKTKLDNKIYKCCFSFKEFLKAWEAHKIDHGGIFCAVTGEPMTMIGLNNKNKKYQRNWSNVSVDRIDSEKPYTIQNIIFVKWDVNRAKGDLPIKHMKKFISIYEDRFVKLKPLN
jgi:hypothetical protein|tara:strand:+ start:17 stop:646 length:630 start_codon:yes stop_codon:yes gene_type:complete